MENGSPNFNNPEPRNSNARNINLSDNVFGPNDAQLEKKFKSLESRPSPPGQFPSVLCMDSRESLLLSFLVCRDNF